MKSILFIIILGLSSVLSPAYAKDVSQEEMITALYIAYNQRGATKAEHDSWTANNTSNADRLKALSTSLLNQSNSIFSSLGNQGFIEEIYGNTLNKEGGF